MKYGKDFLGFVAVVSGARSGISSSTATVIFQNRNVIGY